MSEVLRGSKLDLEGSSSGRDSDIRDSERDGAGDSERDCVPRGSDSDAGGSERDSAPRGSERGGAPRGGDSDAGGSE